MSNKILKKHKYKSIPLAFATLIALFTTLAFSKNVDSNAEPGLYNTDGTLLCKFDESGINYRIDFLEYISAYITKSTYNVDSRSGYSSLKQYPTATQIVLKYNGDRIGANAFKNYDTLKHIVIPSGICSSLVSVEIPTSVTKIDWTAFAECPNLKQIRYKGTKKQWNAIQKYSNWDQATENYTVTFSK